MNALHGKQDVVFHFDLKGDLLQKKKSVKEGQKMEGDDDDDDDGRRMKMRRRQKRFEPFNRYDQRENTFVYLYVFLFFFLSPFVPIEN